MLFLIEFSLVVAPAKFAITSAPPSDLGNICSTEARYGHNILDAILSELSPEIFTIYAEKSSLDVGSLNASCMIFSCIVLSGKSSIILPKS